MLSYIRDLIEQLNRALREVTFSEERCFESILRRLSPRCKEPRLSEGNKAITSSGIKRTTRSKDNVALTPPFYSDYLEDEILDQREIGIRLKEIYWRGYQNFLYSSKDLKFIIWKNDQTWKKIILLKYQKI